MNEKIRVGITQGDSNGVGYEVIIKTLSDVRILDFCIPVLYGSTKVLSFYRKLLKVDPISYNSISLTGDLNPKILNVVNCVADDLHIEPGRATLEAGQAAARALQSAVADLKRNRIDVLVTAPFNKQNMQEAGFSFPGHTEFLAKTFNETDCLMLLISDVLRVGIATGHLSLTEVPEALKKDCIVRKLRLLHHSLRRDFGIHKPRIAVLGLNPHAGDGGLLGKEEEDIIMPAITEAEKQGILAFGPYAADGFFGVAAFRRFDAVLAMYHDQGLAPFKALSFHTGVNYSAGLPIVRTSPAHGVGYDIVNDGTAQPDSFREAIYAACDIWRNRKTFDKITAHPLKAIDVERLPAK
jgi:4-hydroxythreonine-4-phosphate dehydrogenase